MSSELELRRRRAGYRAAHRGTKEMDWLLGRYADWALPGMGEEDLTRFERFLSIADPELHHWILHPETCTGSEFSSLINQLRSFHQLPSDDV